MSRKLIVGNWKMNPQSFKDAEVLFKGVSQAVKDVKGTDIVICPPSLFLSIARKFKNKKIALGAQDVFYEQSGAYTGEISTSMLRDLGVRYVIVGHSERRSLGETDSIANKKLLAILKAKLTPILCVGEWARSHDGSYLQVVKEQLLSCLGGVPKNQIKNIVIAYEPVWALSSTANRYDATPHDFEEMKIYIRKTLTDMFGSSTALSVRILYGGSANKDNAESFLKAGADGLLPGKASLDPQNFGAIVKIASKIK
ncbi:MAG: triose-phosphate isomerase [Patescibacteria group bacterium]